MLISMHGAGIYTGRYGTQPSLGLSGQERHKEAVDAFVAEQEQGYRDLGERLGVSEDERWRNYRLLQIYDRLSLYFCLREVEHGEADEIEPVPTREGGDDVALRIEPAGPWHVRLDPFPFAASPARFTLVRRVLPKAGFDGNESFRAAFRGLVPETVTITIEEA
jgi:hypothetical protein